MITPCVTGLWKGPVLQAMAALGVTACVSDESVTDPSTPDYEPYTPYHGVYSTVATNGFAGIYFVPRQTLDIDYCDTNDAMVTDEYNTMYGEPYLTFEQIMSLQTMYAIQNKVIFKHDPFMMHQANGATFSYNDPVAGETHDVSLITLWMGRVVDEMVSYFSLPIVTTQMDTLVKIFQQRQTMDGCGITTTLNVGNKQVVSVTVTSTSSCQLSLSGLTLSGSTVTMETVGTETTAWIQLTANSPQTFNLATPIPL